MYYYLPHADDIQSDVPHGCETPPKTYTIISLIFCLIAFAAMVSPFFIDWFK